MSAEQNLGWLLLTLAVQNSIGSPLFQCQPSSDESGQVYTPNIPDYYFTPQNATAFFSANLTTAARMTAYIFTIPPESPERNCSGPVVAIEYCHVVASSKIRNRRPSIDFTFFLLSRDREVFTIENEYQIEYRITKSSCADIGSNPPQKVCCNKHDQNFGSDRLLSEANVTFGVVQVRNFELLMFSNSYKYPQLQGIPGSFMGMNDRTSFTSMEVNEVDDQSLLLLRFFIESPPTASNPANVGGVVGGVISGLLLVVGVIIAVLCLVVMRAKHQATQELEGKNNSIAKNELNGGDSPPQLSCFGYAGEGPDALNVQQMQDNKDPELQACDYSYIDSGVIESTNNELTEGEYDIYLVPEKTEKALYGQLRSIKTEHLHREFVELGQSLGSGQFGTVYKGVLEYGTMRTEVAVKTLKEGAGEEAKVKFLQEAAIMGQFKHHNVVEVYGVVVQGEPILLVLELLSKGDLRDYLLHMRSEKGGVSVDDHTLLSYCRQVASGMTYLSNKAFVHRDLAARNILVSDDEICKIADFGMSRDLMDESYYVSHGGMIPVKWAAPEALHYKKYSTASDVWSYGALMYEIWSVGHKPFENYQNIRVLELVDTGYRLPPPPGCPRGIYQIMMSCWHPDAPQRLSFEDLARQLSLPDTKLLKWSEEDKFVHPEAAQLGADLLCGEELYKDFQISYQR